MKVVLNVWNALPARGWPLSQPEEDEFLQQLQQDCEGVQLREPSRSDVTSLMTILRDGASLEEAKAFLPGLDTPGLLSAYRYLDDARQRSAEAWHSVVSNPSATNLAANAEQACVLLPVAVHRVMAAAAQGFTSELRGNVAAAQREVVEATSNAQDLEKLLLDRELSVSQCRSLGAKLYDPVLSAAWFNAYYLPRRVTDLSPNRVRLIVGESS